MSDPEGQLSSSRQASNSDVGHDRQISPRISQRSVQHPPSISQSEARTHELCTPARLSHLAEGLPGANSPMNCRSHVMSPHWNVQSQVRGGSAARTVWFNATGIGQPANTGL